MSLTVTIKGIKPQRFKTEEIKREVEKALDAEGKLHQRELKKTVQTWRKKPKFESLHEYGRGDMIVITGPTGDTEAAQHWVWTDKGTKPHIIRARNAPALRFQVNYSPKTFPRQFTSYHAGSWGPWRRPFSVRHPGTEPRRWSEILSQQRKTPFRNAMLAALRRGADKVY